MTLKERKTSRHVIKILRAESLNTTFLMLYSSIPQTDIHKSPKAAYCKPAAVLPHEKRRKGGFFECLFIELKARAIASRSDTANDRNATTTRPLRIILIVGPANVTSTLP